MPIDRMSDVLEAVLDAGEVGIQVAAYSSGQLVVDEWAGCADPTSGRPVERDTLFPVFSVSKAVAATALHMLVEQGHLDYTDLVADHWPEFASFGKERTRVLDVLTHRAGLPQMPEGVTPELMCDWDWMTSRLAEMKPIHPPGTANEYHPASWGWLVGEIIRRADPKQRSFDRFVDEEICQPLQIQDMWFGVPSHLEAKVACLVLPTPPADDVPADNPMLPAAIGPHIYNRRDVHAACLPGSGGIMSAGAAARFFAFLANGGELDGVRLLSREALMRFTRPRTQPDVPDLLSGKIRWIGSGGYWLAGRPPYSEWIAGSGQSVLWHPGLGGSLGIADLESGSSIAICHNRLFPWEGLGASDHPYARLIGRVREILSDA